MNTFTARYQPTNPCKVCSETITIGSKMVWSRRNKGTYYHDHCFRSLRPEQVQKIESAQSRSEVEEILNQAKVEKIIDEVIEQTEAPVIDVPVVETKSPDVSSHDRHFQFSLLLQVLKSHTQKTPVNAWLVGPAGSGKTKACEQVAEELGLAFYFIGAVSEPYSLLGYKDANGNYVSTTFRQAYENGGVFLLDEVDGSSANALLVFNAALANGHCAFPDKIVTRHERCIIIAAANTYGLGGNSDYVGRIKLDAATLSRFVWIEWKYDEKMEQHLTGNDKWFNRVIAIRHKVVSLGLKILVTPRASYTGAALLKSGIPMATVEQLVIKQGMTDEQWRQVSAAF